MPRDEKSDRDPEGHGLDAESPTLTEGPEAATEGFGAGEDGLAVGKNLGGRYQVVARLGAGGMGEVWRAFDLKLRVEVALKALRAEVATDERRLELLRQEVRAAREVVSPNVCRIFDLVEADGLELVSMEYVDGDTLLHVLQERGPLELKEAQDIASQFLAGLEAIHRAGLVHRDVKPENIMLTRAGRVVLMDFGLARGEDSGAGSVAGTPAYMAPEQAAGQALDSRADVYSAGVVLAEMVSPDGIKSFESRKSVWEGVRSEPAQVPDSPWAPVIQRAVAKDREQRYGSAHTLTRALEDVTLRVEGAEDLRPYPGLASFTEEDAEYFFGREAEVEQMWRRLEGAHLLAIVGPSGAGKSSFIGAGLVPNAPADWVIVRCTPGNAAISSLARSMAREMAGDADAVEMAVGFDDLDVAVELFSRWRESRDHALLVVDQFEELFTLNSADQQERFAELMGRLALEADVRVLLCMRDDFLMQCKSRDGLVPIFESLTPLIPPVGPALRRAVVQPATKCGYRFEDDELVDEILAEVEGERGALPLLAFAMARLWEKRDRGNGLLTRQAYRDIGGVGGALARHAEETIDRIGSDRVPVVRELFRNLVTAEGTRAVREWDELLSVFRDSRSESRAEEVLRQLVDARLLTSYEVPEADEAPTRRVEIIHESLLAAWPRLVRWRTQDQEGAQLRDELRQTARSWDEHGRHDDRLWSGTAYREFRVWQERYPGGLTETEEAFADAMTSLATRRRRRRRIAAVAAVIVFASIAAIFAGLWRRSVFQERRTEAQKLLALAQLELERSPSVALAYAIASLEFADTTESRLLALETLWQGPTALVLHGDDAFIPAFSADGRWLVNSTRDPSSEIRIIRSDGSTSVLERVHETNAVGVSLNPGSDVILTYDFHYNQSPQHLALFSAPDGQLLSEVRYDGAVDWWIHSHSWNRGRVLLQIVENSRASIDAVSFDGARERLGTLDFEFQRDERGYRPNRAAMDRQTGRWIGVVVDGEVRVMEVEEHGLSSPRRLGRQQGSEIRLAFDPVGRYLATANKKGEIRLWDPTGVSPPRVLKGPSGISYLRTARGGLLMAGVLAVDAVDGHKKVWMWSVTDGAPRLLRRFDLGTQAGAWRIDPMRGHLACEHTERKILYWRFGAPADAEPQIVGYHDDANVLPPVFDSQGRWLATSSADGLTLYPLGRPYPSVMRHDQEWVGEVVFGPDGRWLASCAIGGTVRIWPLEGDVPPPGQTLYGGGSVDITQPVDFAVSPDGTHVLVGTLRKREGEGDVLLSLDGGPPRLLQGFRDQTRGLAFSMDGRLAAGAGGSLESDENVIRVWDVASGMELRVLVPKADLSEGPLQFTAGDRLLSSGIDGLRRWNPETGESELVYAGMVFDFSASSDGRRALLAEVVDGTWREERGPAVDLELETGIATHLESHGNRITRVAIDTTGTIAATGDEDGVIRVGPVTGEEPHLLLGHGDSVTALAIDPLGRWIASGAFDGTVRLWPMPDLSKPPLHTLPREELIAKLKTLTNLRIVRDEESATGWKLTHDPFPGWETVPTW